MPKKTAGKNGKPKADTITEAEQPTFALGRDHAQFLAQILPTGHFPQLNAQQVGIVLFIAQQLNQWLGQIATPEQEAQPEPEESVPT